MGPPPPLGDVPTSLQLESDTDDQRVGASCSSDTNRHADDSSVPVASTASAQARHALHVRLAHGCDDAEHDVGGETQHFGRFAVVRPTVALQLRRCATSAWAAFRDFHYKTPAVSQAAEVRESVLLSGTSRMRHLNRLRSHEYSYVLALGFLRALAHAFNA